MAPRLASTEPSRGALVLSAALVPLFVHADYQPSLDGSVTLRLADVAVAAVVVAAAAEARRAGLARLRAGKWLWVAAAAFFGAVAASMLAAAASDRAYPFGEHLVTAAKFAEYALLALCAPLLVRTLDDARAVFTTLSAIAIAATAVGALQLVGVPLFDEWPAGRRQPSFVGHHDFAALSGAALTLAYATLVVGRPSRSAIAAGIAGAAGLVVSGAITAVAGLVLAAVAAALVAWKLGTSSRRLFATLAVSVALVAAGVVAIRSANIAEFLDEEQTGAVETFSHRGVLAYIGLREFLGEPLLGVGWQGSLDEAAYGPYLDDARRRYPDEPARVFPSPREPWGVQNTYIQSLADMGVAGGAALLALVVAGLAVPAAASLRAGPRSPDALVGLTGTLWFCIVLGIWNGIGFIAGLPLDALLWLALGCAAAGAAGIADE